MATTEVIHAYRHLYTAGLRAVQYSYPARTGVRDLIRRAFRAKPAQQLDERAVKRTIWFLKNAAREAGIEHRVVKHMLHVHYWRDRMRRETQPSWTQIVEQTSKRLKPYVSFLFLLGAR